MWKSAKLDDVTGLAVDYVRGDGHILGQGLKVLDALSQLTDVASQAHRRPGYVF